MTGYDFRRVISDILKIVFGEGGGLLSEIII